MEAGADRQSQTLHTQSWGEWRLTGLYSITHHSPQDGKCIVPRYYLHLLPLLRDEFMKYINANGVTVGGRHAKLLLRFDRTSIAELDVIWGLALRVLDGFQMKWYEKNRSKLQLSFLVSLLFAPVPCSASINKSCASNFGPVQVRILWYCYFRVLTMPDGQAPVADVVPLAPALLQQLKSLNQANFSFVFVRPYSYFMACPHGSTCSSVLISPLCSLFLIRLPRFFL